MKIPKYWAVADKEIKHPQLGKLALRKWQWSDISDEDARQKAEQDLQEAIARARFGELTRYPYGSDKPLREEIVQQIELPGINQTAVLTRNSYGALILNVENVMFVDIDGRESAIAPYRPPERGFFSFFKRTKPGIPMPPPPDESVIEHIERWVGFHYGWGFRIYQTASGFRLIATQDTYSPDSASTLAIMAELNCDPVYLNLCKAQKSFRARLTPKPQRIGLSVPGVRYPYSARTVNTMQSWLVKYGRQSEGLATTRYIKTAGPQSTHPTVSAVVEIHDKITGALQPDLPLA